MAIDLSKIKAKLQAEKQVVDAVDPAKEGSDSTVIATVETSTATGESKVTALEVAQQIQEKVRALPTPDPKFSDWEEAEYAALAYTMDSSDYSVYQGQTTTMDKEM